MCTSVKKNKNFDWEMIDETGGGDQPASKQDNNYFDNIFHTFKCGDGRKIIKNSSRAWELLVNMIDKNVYSA